MGFEPRSKVRHCTTRPPRTMVCYSYVKEVVVVVGVAVAVILVVVVVVTVIIKTTKITSTMLEHLHQGQASVMLSSSSSSDGQNVGGNGTGCHRLRTSPAACRCDSLDMQYLHDAFTFLVYLTRLHTALETDRNSFTFSFSAPKMTIYGSFGYFRFRPKLF